MRADVQGLKYSERVSLL
uniref:Uncharacterized protein n=1 Tax=Anguilla anguilla TaxID=7936 RepID=A0A0E9TAI7_ANGAN